MYEIIDKVYKLIGRPIDDIETLLNNCDDKVWDIYANALTTTINQSDSDFGKQTLKRYKPTSLAEVSAWVAAIRPGFASLLSNFLDRLPYSTGVDALDNVLEDSFHYLLYQESIMKYLVWLGIEEKGTYDIIKKIAKKKFKEKELEELQKQLKEGWIKNVGSIDGFAETWQVIQDAAHYSFNASHSLSVAVDSIYGAYLKSHYPLEYFTVVLTMYADDMERTAKLVAELPYFNIKVNPVKFGKSGAEYTMDKETNSIYKGISSIKYCNSQIADELLELSKNTYDSFIDLLADIKSKTSVNSRQLDILVGLDFFSDFGGNAKLLKVVEIYDKLGAVKVIAKKKMEELGLSEFMMMKHCGKETQSQWRDIDNHGLINDLCKNIEDAPLNAMDQMRYEYEYLGSVNYVNSNMSDSYYVIVSFETYKNPCTPVVVIRRMCDGEEIKARVKQSKVFKDRPFGLLSIIKMEFVTYEHKKKLIDGVWQNSEELECVLKDYDVIKNV